MFKKKLDCSELFFTKIPVKEYNSKTKGESKVFSILIWSILIICYFVLDAFDIWPHQFYCDCLYYFSDSVPDFRF